MRGTVQEVLLAVHSLFDTSHSNSTHFDIQFVSYQEIAFFKT